MSQQFEFQDKMRIVQELVPGRQITLAHIIANPDPILYQKLGLDPSLDYQRAAIGVLTVSPAETAVILPLRVYLSTSSRERYTVCSVPTVRANRPL